MSTLWLPLSHHKQRHPADCLAACAAMILDYLNRPIRYKRLLKLLNVIPDEGTTASSIKRLSTLNLSIEYSSGTLDDLERQLTQDIPCIAFVDTIYLSYWIETSQHAVVVVGLDAQHVYLNDPFFDSFPQIVSRLEFELAWDEMDNTYAVITT